MASPETPEATAGNPAEAAALRVNFLDPAKLSFLRRPSGALAAIIDGEICYLEVRVRKAFPITDPGHYVELGDAEGKPIGMIFALGMLKREAREALEEEMARSYIVPVVMRIRSSRVSRGLVYLDVETDRGPAEIHIFHAHDDIVHLRDGRIRIKDALGNIYEIRPRSLDAASFRQLEKII